MQIENKELASLLKKHTEAQETANCLYSEIINELANRGLVAGLEVLSCLNNTEALVWEELILKLVKGYSKNEQYNKGNKL